MGLTYNYGVSRMDKHIEFPDDATPLSDYSGLIPGWVYNLADLNRVEAENIMIAQRKYLKNLKKAPETWHGPEQLKTIFFLMTLLCPFSLAGDLSRNSEIHQFMNSVQSGSHEEVYFSESIRTTFASKGIFSFFRERRQYRGGLHPSVSYESVNYRRTKNGFEKISLETLFPKKSAQISLKDYCQKSLIKNPLSYFSGPEPIKTQLELSELQNFYLEPGAVVIFFEPYMVGGPMDEPFTVRFPYVVEARHDSPEDEGTEING